VCIDCGKKRFPVSHRSESFHLGERDKKGNNCFEVHIFFEYISKEILMQSSTNVVDFESGLALQPIEENMLVTVPTEHDNAAQAQQQLGFRFRSIFEAIGFATPPVSQLEQERHREVLQQLRASGALRGIPPTKEIVAVGHPEFAAMLEKYDTDHHGNIDVEEVHAVVTELNTRKQQSDLLKKILWGAFAFLVFLLISNTLLTVLMIKMTKDVYIDNNSMVSSKGDMLKTEKPKFYTSISSLTSLPAGALHSNDFHHCGWRSVQSDGEW
jgi:hypothetical protein